MKLILILLILILPSSTLAQTDNTRRDPKPVELESVDVKTERLKKKPRHTFNGRFIRSAIGGGGDPLRVLNYLPSLTVLNDFVGILSVRGGGPEDNLYYFDRLPLGYPYHLHGIVSTVNADVIETVEVYPGGYGAEFGADSQAVIDIHSRTQTDTRLSGQVNVNPVYSQAFLDGSLGTRGYWYAFGRRSYMEPLFELLPRLLEIENDLVTEVPRFWSYQGKGVYRLTDMHTLVVNAVAANDSAELSFGTDEVSESDLRGPLKSNTPFDSQGIHFYAEQQRYTAIVSFTRSFSRTALNFGEGYFYRTARSTYALRGDLSYWIEKPTTLLESGFVLSSLPTSLVSVGARPFEEGDPDYNFRLKRDGEKILTATSKNQHRLEGYLQATRDLIDSRYANLYATVGLRTSYLNLIDHLSLQPRGSIGVTLGTDPSNAALRSIFPMQLRFMYGSYVQSPQFYQVVLGEANPEIRPSLARHYVVSLEKPMTSIHTKVTATSYYKDLEDMITYNDSESRYQNQRTGHVKGIEVSLEHARGDGFRGWFSYAYTLSKRTDSPKDDERFYMYNTPHVLAIGLNYLAESWEFGANWQYKSGIFYSPLVDRTRYTNPFTQNTTWLPIYGEPARTAPYHRLDIRFHWAFLRGENWRGGFTTELWNVYNRTNFLQVRYNANFTKEVPVTQLPLIPFLALTMEF